MSMILKAVEWFTGLMIKYIFIYDVKTTKWN